MWIRRLHDFTMPLLGKWWWKLKEEHGSLWFKVLAARFGEDRHFLHAKGERRVNLVDQFS